MTSNVDSSTIATAGEVVHVALPIASKCYLSTSGQVVLQLRFRKADVPQDRPIGELTEGDTEVLSYAVSPAHAAAMISQISNAIVEGFNLAELQAKQQAAASSSTTS